MLASRTGDPSTAVRRLSKAVELAGGLYPRSRTFSRIRLATLLMLMGDVDKATTIGRQAAHEAQTFRSHRMSTELGGLVRACRSQGQNETAVDLNRVISTHSG